MASDLQSNLCPSSHGFGPLAGNAPASPVYKTGVLLINYRGKPYVFVGLFILVDLFNALNVGVRE